MRITCLTANRNEGSKRPACHCGAPDFLHKPFDQIEVLLRIRNLLPTRRIRQLLDTRRAALEEAVHARTSELHDVKGAFVECAKQFHQVLEKAKSTPE